MDEKGPAQADQHLCALVEADMREITEGGLRTFCEVHGWQLASESRKLLRFDKPGVTPITVPRSQIGAAGKRVQRIALLVERFMATLGWPPGMIIQSMKDASALPSWEEEP